MCSKYTVSTKKAFEPKTHEGELTKAYNNNIKGQEGNMYCLRALYMFGHFKVKTTD